jgi:hypothetical protein
MQGYHTANWPLPYMQFAFFLNYLAVYFSSSPKESLEGLCLTPFPNQYEDALVCQDRAKNIEEAISIFFGSPFESPACWNGPVGFADKGLNLKVAPSPPFSMGFSDAWEKLSVDDMLEFDWTKATSEAHIHPAWQGSFSTINEENPWGSGTVYPFVMRTVLSEKSEAL